MKFSNPFKNIHIGNKSKKPTPHVLTTKEYEELGRSMERIFITGYASRKRLILMSLYRGIGYGLGIFIGGTIIVALLASVIAQFEAVDFLKPIIEPIQQTIQETNGGPVVPPPTN